MIKREQFTRWDGELHPEVDNKEYLEYVRVNTDTSWIVISYGYTETIGTKYKWLKLSEVPKHIKVLDTDCTI